MPTCTLPDTTKHQMPLGSKPLKQHIPELYGTLGLVQYRNYCTTGTWYMFCAWCAEEMVSCVSGGRRAASLSTTITAMPNSRSEGTEAAQLWLIELLTHSFMYTCWECYLVSSLLPLLGSHNTDTSEPHLYPGHYWRLKPSGQRDDSYCTFWPTTKTGVHPTEELRPDQWLQPCLCSNIWQSL